MNVISSFSLQLAKTSKDKRLALLLAIVMHSILLLLLMTSLDWKTQTPKPIEAQIWTQLPPMKSNSVLIQNDLGISADSNDTTMGEINLDVLPHSNPNDPTEQNTSSSDATATQNYQASNQSLADANNDATQTNKVDLLSQLQNEALKLSKTSAKQSKQIQITSGDSGQTIDDTYIETIRACIYGGVFYNSGDSVNGNPEVSFQIKLLPNGKQAIPPTLVKSSGLPLFDKAVEDGIRQCNPLPKPPNNAPFPSSIELSYKMF